ncbi:uncharacterized protein EDB91DRAFT_827168 [Suillus paluster]|uniref:uncharacterized protein n=1 Tax=Suillus paluster TaxID=48578 RepID=UPI001B86563D|nr:uncharacterized protein EDB91DRAFT_827168 [Suillus paluster]KAG1748976.1 hypothetical protein EDB91DRAFT_827168 [Suillus paluster]
MPKVAGTRLMVKEKGGKVQVAFRKALGMRQNDDVQFQEIKHHIRNLAVKHFEIGRKPREQEQHIKERFLADVHKAFPIFERNERAYAHLLTYVDRYLHSKAVPSSPFYKTVHGSNDITNEDWAGDDDKSDNSDEHGMVNSEPLGSPFPISQLEEGNKGGSYPVDSDDSIQRQRMVLTKVSDSGSPSPTLADDQVRSPSPDPLAAMPTQYAASRKRSDQPRRASSASKLSASSNVYDTTPIRTFLGRAALSHLLDELVTLGIKNQSRLLLVAAWPEEDLHIFLRDSVRDDRMDKFEARQLAIALRSLRRSMLATVVFDA